MILCSPSNPTGGVLSGGDLAPTAEVIRTCCHRNVRVYSDEIYEWILFDGLAHKSIFSEPGMTVLASGHSRGFAMTGWQLGWAVLPTAEEARIFRQININIMSCVPPFLQEAFGRIGAEGQDFLPLSIANSMEEIQRGVARIAEAADHRANCAAFVREEKLWES